MARPKKHARPDARGRIQAAAAGEFAARGYAATGVDRIARRARVNKALIYYYFGSKEALYRTVLRDGIAAVVAGLRAATDPVDDPAAKLDAYIDRILRISEVAPHLPPIMLRELADGAAHLDDDTLRMLTGLFGVIQGVLAHGVERGAFHALDPLLTHLVVAGSAIFYQANEPLRRRIGRMGQLQPPLSVEPFSEHLRTIIRRAICKDPSNAT